MKTLSAVVMVASSLVLAGCVSHVSSVGSNMSSRQSISEGSPVVTYVDFVDQRPHKEKEKVGMISALLLKTSRPIGAIMADDIAYNLNWAHKIGLKKVFLEDPSNKEKFLKAMKAEGAQYFLSGTIYEFDIASVDAIMDPADGYAKYQVDVYNASGDVIYSKLYEARTSHLIGFTSTSGSDKIINDTLTAATAQLMQDSEFNAALQK